VPLTAERQAKRYIREAGGVPGLSGAFEKILGSASAYWRNLERGFGILLSGEPPSADRLLEEAAEEAAYILGHGTPPELRESLESLPPEVVESGLEAIKKAIVDLTTPPARWAPRRYRSWWARRAWRGSPRRSRGCWTPSGRSRTG